MKRERKRLINQKNGERQSRKRMNEIVTTDIIRWGNIDSRFYSMKADEFCEEKNNTWSVALSKDGVNTKIRRSCRYSNLCAWMSVCCVIEKNRDFGEKLDRTKLIVHSKWWFWPQQMIFKLRFFLNFAFLWSFFKCI